MAEIFKTSDFVDFREYELIKDHVVKYLDDQANGYIAFALDINRDMADELVGQLNELADDMFGEGEWYLGDEEEEYVYCF